jgi:hypothetical protein
VPGDNVVAMLGGSPTWKATSRSRVGGSATAGHGTGTTRCMSATRGEAPTPASGPMRMEYTFSAVPGGTRCGNRLLIGGTGDGEAPSHRRSAGSALTRHAERPGCATTSKRSACSSTSCPRCIGRKRACPSDAQPPRASWRGPGRAAARRLTGFGISATNGRLQCGLRAMAEPRLAGGGATGFGHEGDARGGPYSNVDTHRSAFASPRRPTARDSHR